jgi:hypothetical protein
MRARHYCAPKSPRLRGEVGAISGSLNQRLAGSDLLEVKRKLVARQDELGTASADNTAEKQRGRPFEPGQSGNPTCRPKGLS